MKSKYQTAPKEREKKIEKLKFSVISQIQRKKEKENK
jgi:hypothetical protein